MRVIGFSLTNISAGKYKPLAGKLDIKSGLNIDDISSDKVDISKSEALKFDFTYDISYGENIAKIELKGTVLVLDDKDEGKTILKDWKKKKFDHPMRLSLFNFIMEKCNIKALHFEEELGLPFHIPLPKLAPAPKQTASENKEESKNKASYAG